MKNNLLIILILLISTAVFSQKIEIADNGLFINSNRITEQTSPLDIQNILGKPDRKYLKYNTIWTYDKLGLKIYIDPSTENLKSISIDFKQKNFDFSPKEIYSGELIIYEFYITKYTPIESLMKIRELKFEESYGQIFSATTSYLTLTLEYFESKYKLEGIGISFTNNDF